MIERLEPKQLVTIREAILDIYGEPHIKTAFITGSMAAEKARAKSDVDIFFCHDDAVENPDLKKQEFVDFYFDLHNRLGREPDSISPGEVLSDSELSGAIEHIGFITPEATLAQREFDAICWAGMLVSKRDILVQSDRHIQVLEKVSKNIVSRWVKVLDPTAVMTFETGEHSDADKILRRTISSPGYYDAH